MDKKKKLMYKVTYPKSKRNLFGTEVFKSRKEAKIGLMDAMTGALQLRTKYPDATLRTIRRYAKMKVGKVV